jgi:type I restriction enzyme S subunit
MTLTEIRLGDALRVKHGFAFKGEYFVDDGRFIVLTPGNFHETGGFRTRPGKDRAYSGDIPDDYILNEGDLVIAMTEQGPGLLGSAAVIPEGDRYLHNQRLGLVNELDERVIDRGYLYYLFNTASVRGQISGSATGTKVRHTAPERIYRVRVRVPGVWVQNRISHTLKPYDDLIANNNRRIELLEQSARLLFKEWFVHLRYPGHEHGKIVDGVPEGWKKGAIGDLGNVVTGKTPSKAVQENFGDYIPFIKTPDLHNAVIVIESKEMLSERGAQTQASKFIPPLSTMVSCIGSVGVVAMNAAIAQTNQQINTIIPLKVHFAFYNFFFAQSLKARLEGLGGGATMANVNKGKFESLSCTIPPEALLIAFDAFCRPLFDIVLSLKKQARAAAQARDLLLPRLMDGRLSV